MIFKKFPGKCLGFMGKCYINTSDIDVIYLYFYFRMQTRKRWVKGKDKDKGKGKDCICPLCYTSDIIIILIGFSIGSYLCTSSVQ